MSFRKPAFPLIELLLSTLNDLRAYTLLMNQYLDQCYNAPTITQLTTIRCATQHRVMALPTFDHDTSECCRLAAVVYSLIVVYPLPLVTAPFGKLATLMKAQLRVLDGAEMTTTTLWAAVMGALAAIGTKERRWFVGFIGGLLEEHNVRQCSDLKAILQSYLWDSSISDFDVQYLWMEVKGLT